MRKWLREWLGIAFAAECQVEMQQQLDQLRLQLSELNEDSEMARKSRDEMYRWSQITTAEIDDLKKLLKEHHQEIDRLLQLTLKPQEPPRYRPRTWRQFMSHVS